MPVAIQKASRQLLLCANNTKPDIVVTLRLLFSDLLKYGPFYAFKRVTRADLNTARAIGLAIAAELPQNRSALPASGKVLYRSTENSFIIKYEDNAIVYYKTGRYLTDIINTATRQVLLSLDEGNGYEAFLERLGEMTRFTSVNAEWLDEKVCEFENFTTDLLKLINGDDPKYKEAFQDFCKRRKLDFASILENFRELETTTRTKFKSKYLHEIYKFYRSKKSIFDKLAPYELPKNRLFYVIIDRACKNLVANGMVIRHRPEYIPFDHSKPEHMESVSYVPFDAPEYIPFDHSKPEHMESVRYVPFDAAEHKFNFSKTRNDSNFIFFHGSCDNEDRSRNGDPLTLSKLHMHLKDSNISSYIIDGPNALGNRFTRNIVSGLENLLISVTKKYAAGVREQDIILTGHSRGACEAMAVNNLICKLINSNFDINAVPKPFRVHLTPSLRKNIELLANRFKSGNAPTDKIKIHLLLLDPVRGPDNFLTHRDGYNLLTRLESLANPENHKTIVLTVQNEPRRVMDLFFPRAIPDKMTPILRIRVPTSHTGITRYEKSIHGFDYCASSYNLICKLLGMPELELREIDNVADPRSRIADNFRKGSLREQLEAETANSQPRPR